MPSKRAFRTSIHSFATLLLFASAAGATVTLEPGTDRLGSDYKGFALDQADPQACRQACDADATCKAYTYAKPGVKAPQAMCYLKNAAPLAVANDCCTSGARTSGPIKIKIPPLMPVQMGLKTLTPGPGITPKLPVIKIPANIQPQRLLQLTGGKEGGLFAHFAPNHMSEPGHGVVYFTGPSDVWGGSGSATEPNYAAFTTNSDEHVSELHMTLKPGSKQLLMVDCKVSTTHDDVVYVVSEMMGPEQIFNDKQLVDDHLLFLVNSLGISFVTISADHPWNFYSCDIRAL